MNQGVADPRLTTWLLRHILFILFLHSGNYTKVHCIRQEKAGMFSHTAHISLPLCSSDAFSPLVSLLAPFQNLAAVRIDFKIILYSVVDNISFVFISAIVVIQFNSDIIFRCTGHFGESRLYCFFSADSYISATSILSAVIISVVISVIAYLFNIRTYDLSVCRQYLVIIFCLPRIESYVIDNSSVIPVPGNPDSRSIRFADARRFQCRLQRRILTDILSPCILGSVPAVPPVLSVCSSAVPALSVCPAAAVPFPPFCCVIPEFPHPVNTPAAITAIIAALLISSFFFLPSQ